MKRFLLHLLLATLCFFSSINGQWKQLAPGSYPFSYTWVEAIASDGTNLYAGTHSNGIFQSSDGGDNWTAISTGLPVGSFVYTLAINNGKIFAGTLNFWGMYQTTDKGANWTKVGFNGIEIYSYTKIGEKIFAGTSVGAAVSTDNGVTWANVAIDTKEKVKALAVSGSKFFAGIKGGEWIDYSHYSYGVYLSTDNGVTWNWPTNTGFNKVVNTLSAYGNNLFAGTSSGMYLSVDDGGSWAAANNGLTSANINTAVVSGSNLFVGTYGGGVFLTTDNGTSWNPVNTGLTNLYVYSLAVIGGDLYAGAMMGGLWKRSLSDMVTSVSEKINNEVPVNYALQQNYPNPFNPSTSIRFDIPQSGVVTLKVYNMLGEEAASLLNEFKDAGSYEIKFDASGLSSGIYFYTISTANFVSTKKMILVK